MNIGGKSKVKLEMEDMPQTFANMTSGFFSNKAILFLIFDLTRPETFFDSTGTKEQHHIKYLLNEAATLNRNPHLVRVLVGTNSDKTHSFNRLDAE